MGLGLSEIRGGAEKENTLYLYYQQIISISIYMWSFRVENESPTRTIFKKKFVNIHQTKIHDFVNLGFLVKQVKILKLFMFLFHTLDLKCSLCIFNDPRTIKRCYNNPKLPNTRSFKLCPHRTLSREDVLVKTCMGSQKLFFLTYYWYSTVIYEQNKIKVDFWTV
jgi:hypothetical protein